MKVHLCWRYYDENPTLWPNTRVIYLAISATAVAFVRRFIWTCSDCGHYLYFDKVKILDRDYSYFERGVKEAVYISVHQPSLIVNKDRGRHHLSSVYDPILTSSGQVNINLLTKASNSLRCWIFQVNNSCVLGKSWILIKSFLLFCSSTQVTNRWRDKGRHQVD